MLENIKDAENFIGFKAKIKFWKPESCPCRLCKVYLPQIGFIWWEIWSKPHFKVGEISGLIVSRSLWYDNHELTDVFNENVNWLFWLGLLVGARFGQGYNHIFSAFVEIGRLYNYRLLGGTFHWKLISYRTWPSALQINLVVCVSGVLLKSSSEQIIQYIFISSDFKIRL